MDYTHVPLCQASNAHLQPIVSQSAWQKAVTAMHGDVFYEELALPIYFRRNVYCGQLCVLQPPLDDVYGHAIQNQFAYQFLIDNLPVAHWSETQDMVSIQYWGGIPLGQAFNEMDDRYADLLTTATEEEEEKSSLYIYNHYRIEIVHDDEHILRTTIQPLSIQYNVTDFSKWPALPMGEPMPKSCQDRSQHLPIYYGQVKDIPPQALPQSNNEQQQQQQQQHQPILFTYDVIWTPYQGTSKNPYLSRWSVFLQMDNGIPIAVPLFGLLVAILINCMLIGVLATWMLRDLSYKPLAVMSLMEELSSEEEQREAQLWPLSTRVFFKPQHGSVALSVLCGTGAQWLLTGCVFVFFFRVGMINESLGANILTAAVVLYVLASGPAGYVSGRMTVLFHGTRNMALYTSFAVATILPVVGMIVIHLVYDVLPEETTAPMFRAMYHSTPILLTWLFLAIPMTIGGGYWGFTHGPLANFPVSSGSTGYQDLALQDKSQENQWEEDDVYADCKSPLAKKFAICWKKDCRLPVLFLLGGLPPMACGFIEYAYGVAGPIFMGYFSGTSFFAIASFALFLLCVSAISVLLFYKQIRTQNYHWWWASFVTGASSGLYIFLLSMSWVCLDASGRDVSGRTMFGFFLWFLFTSFGVGLMAGFVAVLSCVLFSRMLYSKLLRRMKNRHSEESSLIGRQERQNRLESEASTTTGQLSSSFPLDDDSESEVTRGDGIMLAPKKRQTAFRTGKSASGATARSQTAMVRNSVSLPSSSFSVSQGDV
jgi:hypothetical protein